MSVSESRNLVAQFLSYALIGGLSTLVDLGVFNGVLLALGAAAYVSATVAGTVVGATVNYLLQKYVTFKEGSLPHDRQLASYVVIVIISIGLSVALMVFFVGTLGMGENAAWVLKTGGMLFFNYLAHRSVTFNKRLWER